MSPTPLACLALGRADAQLAHTGRGCAFQLRRGAASAYPVFDESKHHLAPVPRWTGAFLLTCCPRNSSAHWRVGASESCAVVTVPVPPPGNAPELFSFFASSLPAT